MSFRASIQKAIQAGFNALGDGQKTVTYVSVTAAAFNATTGAVSRTQTTHAGVKAVFDQYDRREIDLDVIRPEDQKVLIAKLNLTPTPRLNDRLTESDGTTWEVIGVKTDPLNAHWELQVRRP